MPSVSFFTTPAYLNESESRGTGQEIDVPLEVLIPIVECLATSDLNTLALVCQLFNDVINSSLLIGECRLRAAFIVEKKNFDQQVADHSKALARYGNWDFKLLVLNVQLEIQRKHIQESFIYRFKNSWTSRFSFLEPYADSSISQLNREMREISRMKKSVQDKINHLISSPIPLPPVFSAYKKWKWEWLQACHAFSGDQLIYDLFGGKARYQQFLLSQAQKSDCVESHNDSVIQFIEEKGASPAFTVKTKNYLWVIQKNRQSWICINNGETISLIESGKIVNESLYREMKRAIQYC